MRKVVTKNRYSIARVSFVNFSYWQYLDQVIFFWRNNDAVTSFDTKIRTVEQSTEITLREYGFELIRS